MRSFAPLAALLALIGTAQAADLPDLGGREITVVTENAYPPLQFLDAGGTAIGWEYDAMAEIAKRLNLAVSYETTSWDAMIPAVSGGQYDMGMTGITIREDRMEMVDFSDAYMRSEMVMLVRGDEARFTDAASFAADPDLLMAAQPGTTPFYVGVYEVLDGDEANPRIIKFETFGAGVAALKAGDVDLALTDGTAGNGYVEASNGGLKIVGSPLGTEDFGFIFPKGLGSGGPDQPGDPVDEGRRHDRGAEQEVAPGLQAGAIEGWRGAGDRAGDPGGCGGAVLTRPPSADRDFPWWLVILGITAAWLIWRVVADDLYRQVLATLSKGLALTVLVTLVAYGLASVLGLGLALMQLSRWLVVRQAARLYVEVIRGIPIIVLLLYVAFVLAPALIAFWNWATGWTGLEPARTRDIPLLWRAVLALTLAYASFLAEVFRAGILSVDPGQIEAAQALGLRRGQRFGLIVAPQAFRTILPPYGNDFVAMVKDSSLVSVLGVADVTQLGKITAAGNFRYFETYNVVALIYLVLTVSLSLGLRRLEQQLRQRP